MRTYHLTIAPLRWCTVHYSSLFKCLCGIPVSDWLRPNSIWKADFAVLWNAFRSWHRFQVSWVFWIELIWTALRRPSHSFRNVIRQVDPNSATLSIQSKLQCYSNAFQAHALLMHYSCIQSNTVPKLYAAITFGKSFLASGNCFQTLWGHFWSSVTLVGSTCYSKACVNMTWYIDDWKMLAGWFSPTWCAKNCGTRLSTCLAFRFTRQLDIW